MLFCTHSHSRTIDPLGGFRDLTTKPLLGDPVQLSNLRIRLLLNAGSITILVPVTRIDLCGWNVKIKILWFFTLKKNVHIPAII